jgi:RNA polymerase sigma-54 factor
MSKIEQKLHQSHQLNPRQILEANIVQLSIINLEKRIFQELEKNPALEIDDDNESSDTEPEADEDFDLEELISNSEEQEYSFSIKPDFIDNMQDVESVSLIEDIMSQMDEVSSSEDEIKVAKHILGNLDENGFLPIEPILIADRLGYKESFVTDVKKKIQSLDPPGIGSSSIKESIISQLQKYYNEDYISLDIIKNYFDLFSKHKYELIAKKMKCSEEQVFKTVEVVSVLNPYPAINYSSSIADHIIPDIIIEYIDNRWDVQINEPNIPIIRISNQYISMLNKYKKDENIRTFVKQKINRAEWFIHAINQRNRTIEKVMKSIIKHQKLYFESDKRILSPMILKDIAGDINMDISTISRVSNGKYVQMPWGIKELKSFFSEGIQMKNGKIISSTIVKSELKEILDNENKKNPLNDESITKKLNNKGYLIARRTVSKYRESLRIPVSRLRKI